MIFNNYSIRKVIYLNTPPHPTPFKKMLKMINTLEEKNDLVNVKQSFRNVHWFNLPTMY